MSIKTKNFSLLPKNPGTSKVKSFARIRSFNSKNEAITHDGIKVERQEYIFVEGYGMVRTLPTTMHFIYEDKSKKMGRWAFMCTCGSISGIVSYKELKGLISPELGEYVLACIHGLAHKQNTGIFRHADGSTE
jgi:hypothetical protein